MKSWKKQLKDELNATVPELKEEVKNAPIITAQEDASYIRSGDVLVKRKIGILTYCAVVAILVIAIAFMAIFGVFAPEPILDRYVFSLEINPAVSFVTDKEGNVKSVKALNEDADVVLSNESALNKIIGAPLSEAVVVYTDCATRLGYLDLTLTQNAVRLSSSSDTDKNLIATTSDSLRNYFMTNGIYVAVIEDVISAQDLSKRMGISGVKTLSDLTKKVLSLSVNYGERNIATANEEQLKSIYETYVVGTQLFDFVRGELLDNVNSIIRNAQMLSQIGICSYNIMMHKDNPFNPIPADYWTIKKYPNAQYSAEFSELMNEMESLLAEYENTFGASIGSLADLTSATNAYASLSGIDFEDLFKNLTANGFLALAENFVGILKNIGSDVATFETLLNTPKTSEEYVAQMKTALGKIFDYRAERYLDIYEAKREQITSADYDAFINGIVEEYGSLDNFWNKK